MNGRDHSWQPVDLASLDTLEPVRPDIGGIVYPGKTHLWSGEPETAKTLAAQALAVDQVRAGATVVWVDFEMGARDTLSRLRDLGLRDDELDRIIYIAPEVPITSPEILIDVEQLLIGRRPTLVVIDSYTPALELHGCHPNDSLDIQRFARTVVGPLREHGAAVVEIDHLVKDKERRGKFSTGSERKLGVVDVHLGFEIVKPLSRGGTGLYRIVTHKDRGGFLKRPKAGEIEFTSSPTGTLEWSLRPASETAESGADGFRPTALMERVSIYLEMQPLPVSRNTVEQAVQGKAKWVRVAIDALASDHYINEAPGANRARLIESVKPFRADEFVPGSSLAESVEFVPEFVP